MPPTQLAFRLVPGDLLRWRRTPRAGRLLLLVVDISGSMGTALLTLGRRIALGLLHDAYLRRDRVAMVAFRDRSAELLFAPTARPEQVHRAVNGLACGGTTPLGPALRLARETLGRSRAREPTVRTELVVISDGRANVGARPGYEAVLAEVEAAARALRSDPWLPIVLLDATEAQKNDEPARRLAEQLGAWRVALRALPGQGTDPMEQVIRALDGARGSIGWRA